MSTDHDGRILSVKVEMNDTTVQVCNVYCPTDGTERFDFLDNLPTYIKGDTHLIIGNDWNCVENPQMEKFGGNPHRGTAGLASLRFLSQTYGLVDVFRKHNPTARSFTWFTPNSSIGVRLDRFYLTHDIFRASKTSRYNVFLIPTMTASLLSLPPPPPPPPIHRNEAPVAGN